MVRSVENRAGREDIGQLVPTAVVFEAAQPARLNPRTIEKQQRITALEKEYGMSRREILYELYWNQGLTLEETGKKLGGISARSVVFWMNEVGIVHRTRAQARVIFQSNTERVTKAKEEARKTRKPKGRPKGKRQVVKELLQKKVKRAGRQGKDGDLTSTQKDIIAKLFLTNAQKLPTISEVARNERLSYKAVRNLRNTALISMGIPVLDQQDTRRNKAKSKRAYHHRKADDIELIEAMRSHMGNILTPRELRIMNARHPQKGFIVRLETLGIEFGITRERVRQIENEAIEKLDKNFIS